MNALIEQAKESAKNKGYDLRSREAKFYISRQVAKLERQQTKQELQEKQDKRWNKKGVAHKKLETAAKKVKTPKDAPLSSCLCGCGKEISKNFVQGHDAKLKSAILRGEQVPHYGFTYASVMWPDIVARMGQNKK